MPRSYASDLLVDDIDLDGERVAGPPYRAGRRRSDVFMVVVAAAASAAVLFNALALQQARQGASSRQAAPLPAAAPADIRQVETPPSASAPAAISAAPAESLMATPVAPLPPSKPAPPPRPAAPAAASVVTPSVSAPSAPAQGLVPPGEVPVSPRIIEIQKALARLGYGPIRIDGRLGAATEEAITRFERDRRLPVTGQISDRVIRELNAVSGLSIQ